MRLSEIAEHDDGRFTRETTSLREITSLTRRDSATAARTSVRPTATARVDVDHIARARETRDVETNRSHSYSRRTLRRGPPRNYTEAG
jgi:hypothetical protein